MAPHQDDGHDGHLRQAARRPAHLSLHHLAVLTAAAVHTAPPVGRQSAATAPQHGRTAVFGTSSLLSPRHKIVREVDSGREIATSPAVYMSGLPGPPPAALGHNVSILTAAIAGPTPPRPGIEKSTQRPAGRALDLPSTEPHIGLLSLPPHAQVRHQGDLRRVAGQKR